MALNFPQIRLPVLQSTNLHVNVGNEAGAGQGTNTSSGSGGDLASTTKATLPLRDQQQLAITSTQSQVQNVSQPSTPATPSSAGSSSSGGLPFGNVSKSFISGRKF